MKNRPLLTLGSTSARLAQSQATTVLERLQAAHPRLAFAPVTVEVSDGDAEKTGPFLAESEATAAAVDARLLAGDFRLAVRYASDLAGPLPAGLMRAAVLERTTPYDAFLNRQGRITDEMPSDAVIGVLNLRARAQMQALWPHLTARVLRGGVEHAVEAMMRQGVVDGLVLPAVVTEHLGIQALVTELYFPEMMLPGVGQGTVVLLCREDDEEAREAAQALHSQASAWELDAETAFVERVAADRDVPVGVLAQVEGRRILVTGAIGSPSGGSINRAATRGVAAQAAQVGAALAEQLVLSGDSLLDLLEADFPEGLPTVEPDDDDEDNDPSAAARLADDVPGAVEDEDLED